jgi:hypothetical protein
MSDLEAQSAATATSSDSPQQTNHDSGASAGLTQWQRVADAFTAPSKTFADIRRGNRSWWLPLIIGALASYLLFAAVTQKIGIQQTVDNQIRMSPKTEEKLAQATPEQRALSNKISVWTTEGAFAASPLLGMLSVAVLSLGLMGTINFVFGGKAKYGQVFAVFYYASLPSIVKTLLGTIVIYAGMTPESFNIKNFSPTNLGAFLDPVETNQVLYALASSLDAVTIWTLVLLSMGISAVAGAKRGAGYIAVFGWWAIFVLFSVGMAVVAG